MDYYLQEYAPVELPEEVTLPENALYFSTYTAPTYITYYIQVGPYSGTT
jgi:hypothetical protein